MGNGWLIEPKLPIRSKAVELRIDRVEVERPAGRGHVFITRDVPLGDIGSVPSQTLKV
jgi:hypothetical protein